MDLTQKPDEPFLAQAAFGDAVYQSNRNKTRILIRSKKHSLHLHGRFSYFHSENRNQTQGVLNMDS